MLELCPQRFSVLASEQQRSSGEGIYRRCSSRGAQGYVILMAAGERAVLTVMAEHGAKLGLVLYDMKATSARIADILR